MSFNKDLFKILSSSPVAPLLARNKAGTGPGIYPDVLPQNAALPAIVSQLVSGDSEHDLNGGSGFGKTTMQINVISNSRETSDNVCERVRQALVGYRGKPVDRFWCSVRSLNPTNSAVPARDGSEVWRYVSSRDFEISHQEAVVVTHQ